MVVLPLDYYSGKSSAKSLRRRKLLQEYQESDGNGKQMKAYNKRKIMSVSRKQNKK